MKQIYFVLGLGLLLVCASLSPQQSLFAQSDASLLFYPRYINDVDGAKSALYVQNQGDGLATVNITFYQGNGSIEAQVDDVIPAGGVNVYEEPPLAVATGFEGSVVIASDQPIAGVVYESNNDGSIAAYRSVDDGTNQQHFGPFYNTPEVMSSLWIMNTGPATTTVNVAYAETAIMETAMITPGAAAQFDGFPGLANGYVGAATATADAGGEITGVVVQTAVSSPQKSIQLGQAAGQSYNFVPHLFKNADLISENQRTSELLLNNLATDSVNANVAFYNAAGSIAHTVDIVLEGSGTHLVDVTSLATGVYSAVVSSDQLLSVGDAVFAVEPSSIAVAEYEGVSALDSSYLPYLTTTDDAFSVVTLQNQDTTTATLTLAYYDMMGSLVDQQTNIVVEPGASAVLNLQDNEALPDNFMGSGLVSSSSGILARVSQYQTNACEPITMLQINRVPAGDLIAGVPATFTAVADGTNNQYQWRINGEQVGDGTETLVYTFEAGGEYLIDVTATNGCSSNNTAIAETVIESCDALANPQIGRVPAGDIFVGHVVQFAAEADGTMPADYAWLLNGMPVGANSSFFEYEATETGAYFLEVTMHNACSEVAATAAFSVRTKLFLPLMHR